MSMMIIRMRDVVKNNRWITLKTVLMHIALKYTYV